MYQIYIKAELELLRRALVGLCKLEVKQNSSVCCLWVLFLRFSFFSLYCKRVVFLAAR